MAEEAPDTGPEDQPDQPDNNQPDQPDDDHEPEEVGDPAKLKADRDKAIDRRDRALKRAREAEAELAELKKGSKPNDPDPVAEANGRLIRSEAKGLLAARGVTDREDQAAILDVLNLADVDVDARGDVDVDAIEEKIGKLWEIVSGAAERDPARRRTPRTDTRDRGRTAPGLSGDAARYDRILRGRR